MINELYPLGPSLPPTVLACRAASRKPAVGQLTDGSVKVVPYDEVSHLDGMFQLFSRAPSVFTYLGKADTGAGTIEDTRRWIHAYSELPDCQTFVIFVNTAADGSASTKGSSEWKLAGTSSYLAFRPDDLVIEIGNVAGT